MGKGIFTGLPKQMLDLIKNKISAYKDEATNVKGVEAIGYDEANGKLLLKVEGADSVVPFNKGNNYLRYDEGTGYIQALNTNGVWVNICDVDTFPIEGIGVNVNWTLKIPIIFYMYTYYGKPLASTVTQYYNITCMNGVILTYTTPATGDCGSMSDKSRGYNYTLYTYIRCGEPILTFKEGLTPKNFKVSFSLSSRMRKTANGFTDYSTAGTINGYVEYTDGVLSYSPTSNAQTSSHASGSSDNTYNIYWYHECTAVSAPTLTFI